MAAPGAPTGRKIPGATQKKEPVPGDLCRMADDQPGHGYAVRFASASRESSESSEPFPDGKQIRNGHIATRCQSHTTQARLKTFCLPALQFCIQSGDMLMSVSALRVSQASYEITLGADGEG